MKYIAVVSCLPYTYNESVNLRGSPATHAIAEADKSRTLCGKNPDGWNWLGLVVDDVNCKTCLRIMATETKNVSGRGKP